MWNLLMNVALFGSIPVVLAVAGKFNHWDKNPGQYPARDRWHP